MPSKLTFYKQETEHSCVPACLRMVLASFEIKISEIELRDRCDCNFLGTDALKVVEVSRKLGFRGTVKCTLSIEDLIAQINSEIYPIVYLNLKPIDGYACSHAMVVAAVEESIVIVYDLLQGERTIPRSVFETAWKIQHHLSILVQH